MTQERAGSSKGEWDDWMPDPSPGPVVSDHDFWRDYQADAEEANLSLTSGGRGAELDPSTRPVRARHISGSRRRSSDSESRSRWPSLLLVMALGGVTLAGLALYLAMDGIDVLDPGTLTDAGLLLAGAFALCGLVAACMLGSVVALVRRKSIWRAAATLGTGLVVGPVVLYLAAIEGIDAMRQNAGSSVVGYVPQGAVKLRELAAEEGVDLGWLELILTLVAGG